MITKKQLEKLTKMVNDRRKQKFNDIPVEKWEVLALVNASELDWPEIMKEIETLKNNPVKRNPARKNYKFVHECGNVTFLMLTKPEAEVLARHRTALCFNSMEVVKYDKPAAL